MINWGAYQTLPSFSPVRHTGAGWSDTRTPLSDKFLDVPGVDPDELYTGIRQEWQTCGADPELAKKVALKNIQNDPHYYSALAKYNVEEGAVKEDFVITSKDVNPFDLFAGISAEKAKGLSIRKAGIEALGKLSAEPGFYNGEKYMEPQTPVIYGDYAPIGNTKGNTIDYNDTKPFGDAQTTIAAASMDSDKTPNVANLQENARKYPMGMLKTWKFFQMADDSQIAHFNSLLQKGQYDKGWEVVQELVEPKSDAVDGDYQKMKTNPEKMEKIAESQITGTAPTSTVDEETDPAELAMGITVEMEHTDNDLVAAEIAKDHLKKDGHYYTKLQKAGLADECAPSTSSGLGDEAHPINKDFRIGEDGTGGAGNNRIGRMGNTPPVSNKMGKQDYSKLREVGDQPADWSLKAAMHKVFTENKNLNKKDPKMVGRWTINAFPVNENETKNPMKKTINENLFVRPTKVFNPKYKKAINEMAIVMKVGFPTLEKLNSVAAKYTETIQEAQELVEDYCDSYKVGFYKKLLSLNENKEVKDKFEKEYGDKKGDKVYYATANKQDRDKETFKKNECDGGHTIATAPNPELTAGFDNNVVKEKYSKMKESISEILSVLGSSFGVDEHGAADDLGKSGCGYSWAAEPGAAIKTEGVGKMSIGNIKETLTKKLSEMDKCYGTGDYAALTKHTTNGQISMLEKIKEAIASKNSLNEAKRSEYKKFFGI